MVCTKKRIELLFRKRSVLMLGLCGFVFISSIILLFIQEKRRMDAEFESMISDSLKIHTLSDANRINQAIDNASRALKIAKTIFMLAGSDGPQDFLKSRNAANPVYIVEYIEMKEIQENTSPLFMQPNQTEVLLQLMRGEMAVSGIFYDEDRSEYSIAVFLPMRENEITTGTMYTRLLADNLLPRGTESAVYQDIQNALITSDGNVVFNTFTRVQGGNLVDALNAYGLTHAETDRISEAIFSPDVDSATFLRKGENYFVSAAPLRYNGWNLVSFVRGPDVLLRSANIFRDVLRTSVIAILITAIVAGIVFRQLLSSKRELMEEQQRNYAYAQRFQAMFNQHNAMMGVVDMETREIIDANPSILNYFGYTIEDVMGHKAQEFNLLPEEIVVEKYRNSLTGDVLFSAAPYRLRSGEIRLLDAYASTIMEGGA